MDIHDCIGFMRIFSIFVYFFPSIYAYYTNDKYRHSILILNTFLGWTSLGWVGALIWTILPKVNVNRRIEL